jgi:hypothetical protein
MKPLIIVLAIVAAVLGGIGYFALRDDDADSRRQSAEAAPVGLVATPATWWDGEDNEEGHTVTFAFVDQANGVHTGELKQITWWRDGKWKVCYNPADPKDYELYPADHTCGS